MSKSSIKIINQLGELLYDKDSRVHCIAAEILGLIGSNLPAKISSQLGEFLNDQDSDVRNSAVKALGIIGENLPEVIIRQMVELIHEKDIYLNNSSFSIPACFRIDIIVPFGKSFL